MEKNAQEWGLTYKVRKERTIQLSKFVICEDLVGDRRILWGTVGSCEGQEDLVGDRPSDS